ncbi:MAG: hypothetical protein HQK57_06940 [Deltaproteobacteria bacterium]|nr:hypothetical protein [Deltaproteobacteria bacterium]
MNVSDVDRIFDCLDQHLGYLNRHFGLMTEARQTRLTRDIRYLLLDNIARRIRLAFYDPADREAILLQFVYSLEDEVELPDHINFTLNESLGSIAFDVFIEFTEAFLSLPKEDRELLINNTETKWHTYY